MRYTLWRDGTFGRRLCNQIDANTLQIAARGNGYTGSDTVQRYVLLRAAEETAKRGFDLFLIVSSKDVTQTLYSVSSSANSVSSSTNSVTMTTSSGLAIPVPLPGEDVLVKMFKGEKPADAPPNLYKASEVIQYVGPTVKRDP